MNTKQLLLIFTRNPELGKVKSRLAKAIGEHKALLIYKELLVHTKNITQSIAVDKWLLYSENIIKNDFWDNRVYTKKSQRGTDLGERMQNAFKDGFEAGYEQIIIVGSDIYDLKQTDIENAFNSLTKNNIVIGPAEDGGYYLLGLNELQTSVFKNKEWGTSTVYRDTLNDLKGIHPIKKLKVLNDIDVISDIKTDSKLYKLVL